MKKKSKHKPRTLITNPIAYVINNVSTLSSEKSQEIKMRASNHAAIDEISMGRGTAEHMRVLIDAFNMAFVLAKRGKGKDWLPEIGNAQAALDTLAHRSTRIGRYTLTGPELQAIRLGLEIHDAQLDEVSIGELGSAVDYIVQRTLAKQVRMLPKAPA